MLHVDLAKMYIGLNYRLNIINTLATVLKWAHHPVRLWKYTISLVPYSCFALLCFVKPIGNSCWHELQAVTAFWRSTAVYVSHPGKQITSPWGVTTLNSNQVITSWSCASGGGLDGRPQAGVGGLGVLLLEMFLSSFPQLGWDESIKDYQSKIDLPSSSWRLYRRVYHVQRIKFP